MSRRRFCSSFRSLFRVRLFSTAVDYCTGKYLGLDKKNYYFKYTISLLRRIERIISTKPLGFNMHFSLNGLKRIFSDMNKT
jgi:hypothetical protein